jgi:hypothetical protein
MSMTKKDFEAIAAAIADTGMGASDTIPDEVRLEFALSMADAMVSQSDGFRVGMFLRAAMAGTGYSQADLARLAGEYSNRLRIRLHSEAMSAANRT